MNIERRQHPRIPLEAPVRVFGRAGGSREASLVDLSVGGLRLSVDDALLDFVEEDDSPGHRIVPTEFRVEYALLLDGQPLAVGVQCRLVYKRRLSQHAYQIGLKALAYDPGHEERVLRYVTATLG